MCHLLFRQLSPLIKSVSSLEHRIARIESSLSLLDRLERILEIFNARMAEFDEMFQRLGDVESMTGRLAVVTDGLSDLVAMGARQVILEERFARLEGKVIIGPAISADGSHALPDKLSANFERIINEQRDYELIVFGSQ